MRHAGASASWHSRSMRPSQRDQPARTVNLTAPADSSAVPHLTAAGFASCVQHAKVLLLLGRLSCRLAASNRHSSDRLHRQCDACCCWRARPAAWPRASRFQFGCRFSACLRLFTPGQGPCASSCSAQAGGWAPARWRRRCTLGTRPPHSCAAPSACGQLSAASCSSECASWRATRLTHSRWPRPWRGTTHAYRWRASVPHAPQVLHLHPPVSPLLRRTATCHSGMHCAEQPASCSSAGLQASAMGRHYTGSQSPGRLP